MVGLRQAVPGWLPAAVLGLLAGVVLWMATPWGLGVEHDSVFYWSAAENLLEGRGLGRVDGSGSFIPLTHFPPLYPLALAAVARVGGISVAAAARLLGAGLSGLNVFLLWRAVIGLGAGRTAAWASALVFLAAPTIVERPLWIMSEALYFCWLLLALDALVRSIGEPGWRWLLAAAAASGLASLTRYAGLSILAGGAAGLLLLEARPWRARLPRAGLLIVLGWLPPIAWQLRNWLRSGTPTNRALLFHPPQASQVREAGSTLAGWLPYPAIPAELRFGLLALAALAALVFLIRRGRHHPELRETAAWRMAWLSGLHAAAYLGMLGLSLTFFDASTRLRDRILSPVFLVAVLAAAGLFAMRGPTPSRALRLAALAGLAVLILPFSAATLERLRESQNGLGFVGPAWRRSETLALTRQLPVGLQLFSNEAFPIYFLTGRPASWVPEQIDPVKGIEREGYRLELQAMLARIEAGEAALVVFHPQALRPELPPLDELTGGRAPTRTGNDGWILMGSPGGGG